MWKQNSHLYTLESIHGSAGFTPRTSIGGFTYPKVLLRAHWRVHVSEDIVFNHYGEDKEDGVAGEADDAQFLIQLPTTEVNRDYL